MSCLNKLKTKLKNKHDELYEPKRNSVSKISKRRIIKPRVNYISYFV